MHSIRNFACALLLFVAAVVRLDAAEVIPPMPAGYFNDYANVVSKSAALLFNEQLAQFERETSNQVVVAVYPKMQTDSDIADYGQRIAQSWGIGQKSRSQGNGVLLLVFIQDHKISLQVGYGLEGALPDVTAFDIRERHINPHFRSGDYEGGLRVGIDLILKAIRGEYKGTGGTVRESENSGSGGGIPFALLVGFIIFLILISRMSRRRGWGYSSFGGPFIGGGWGGGGGGWSGGSSGGGFSGFSGGGGSFGGGGSSGSW